MRNKNNALEISVKTVSEENLALISLRACLFMLLEKAVLTQTCLTSNRSEISQGLQIIPKVLGNLVCSQLPML